MRPNIKYDVPSTAYTIALLAMDMLVFGLMAFYFDHVDNSNRGKNYSKYFFIEPIIKKCRRKKNTLCESNQIEIDRLQALINKQLTRSESSNFNSCKN
jgi:hypothetical protein